MGKEITRLPPSVVSHLRSSTILSNVAQIAEELVCNSLDAGATKIEIAVDGEACHMRVDDDGCGISRDDLTLVGVRHATSKLHRLEDLEGGVGTLGFRGEALSSLSDISLVEITSRCRGMPNTYRKILKGGAALSTGLTGEQRKHGTTVVVKDMFYNQPVRRRLLNTSKRKILQSVKECVMRYVLIHPQVSFTVKDLSSKDILMNTKSGATLSSTLCDIFGPDTFTKLQEIDYARGPHRLTGFLSKSCHSQFSKALQYFYINRRYVLKTALHKLINSYGTKSKDYIGQNISEEQGARREMASGRHLCPAFVLNLTCPLSDYDISFEPSKTLVEFKDWKPVVDFVKTILHEIWQDQSIGNRQGLCQAPEGTSALKQTRNGEIHHRKSFTRPDGNSDEIPPMAVRRALVQSDSFHPRDMKQDHFSKDLPATTSVDIPEKRRVASSTVPSASVSDKMTTNLETLSNTNFENSVPSTCLYGKKTANLETFSKMNFKEKVSPHDARIFDAYCDAGNDCTASPKAFWHMAACRQKWNPDHPVEELFPAILGSDWLSNGALSPGSKEQNLLHSGTAAVSLPFPRGETSASIPRKSLHKSSSFASERFLRRSSSPPHTCNIPSDWFSNGALSQGSKEQNLLHSETAAVSFPISIGETIASRLEKSLHKCSSLSNKRFLRSRSSPPDCNSPSERLIKKSRNPGRGVRFKDEEDVISLSPDEGTHEKRGEKRWDPHNLILETPPSSPSNDSIGIPRILDTSDFVPEVDSFSLECPSSGKHPSHDWKWPEFDSDYSEIETSLSPRVQIKRRRVKRGYGSDSDELAYFLSVKSYSFDPKSDNYLGSIVSNKPDYLNCKYDALDAAVDMNVGVTDSDSAEKPFRSTVDRIFSPDGEEASHHFQREGCAVESYSHQPQSKRRLDLDLDAGSDNMKLQSENCEKQTPRKKDDVPLASASRIRLTMRGYSGPPFYRPTKRYGAHLNPINSLSTVQKVGKIAEDAGVKELKPGQRSEIAFQAHCERRKERDMPQKGAEVTEMPTIQPGYSGLDCNGQSTGAIQSTPFVGELEEHRERITFSEAERPLDVPASIRQTEEVDILRHCKYRSSEVNSAVTDGVKLPMDTVTAMFKEWSNPCMKKDDVILDLSSGILASSISSLIPGSITKDALKQARVLRQVDAKFIVAVSCGVLLLIDQHAADERVRLEEFRKEVLGGMITKESSLLSSTQQLTMTFPEQQTLQTYCEQIQDWGWHFKVLAHKMLHNSQRQRSSTGGMCKVLLTAVPSMLGVKLTGADLVEYVQQLTDTQGSSTPPPAVIRLLNNKACRGAIMFGDKLLPSECKQLIDHLKKTLLCFQCAHGRPTMVPLVDIQALHRRFDPTSGRSKPGDNVDSETGFDGLPKANASRRWWHGLQPVKPNLERAQARLARANGAEPSH